MLEAFSWSLKTSGLAQLGIIHPLVRSSVLPTEVAAWRLLGSVCQGEERAAAKWEAGMILCFPPLLLCPEFQRSAFAPRDVRLLELPKTLAGNQVILSPDVEP